MIRALHAGDVPAALDLWDGLMANGLAYEPRWVRAPDARAVIEPWIRSWTRTTPFPHCLVWDDGATTSVSLGIKALISGFPSTALPVLDRPPVARISDLYVAPELRRQGVGRALVEAFVAGARAGGHPQIEVGTLTADTRAVAFWKAMGFGDWQVTLRRDD